MKRLVSAALILLVAAAGFPAAAEKAEPSIFDQLAGAWISDGPAFGAPAASRMQWQSSLDGKFTRLDYKIEMRSPEGTLSTFEGVAFYRAAGEHSIDAFWADNSGDLHPISAEHEGDALIAHWGVEGGKQGRTRYELSSVDEITVTDWIKTDEGWRQFNHNVFKRVSAD